MDGQDLAATVSPTEVSHHGDGEGPRIAVIDTGIKGSIVRNLVARGARVALYPCATPRGGPAGAATPTRSCSPTAPATRRRWST